MSGARAARGAALLVLAAALCAVFALSAHAGEEAYVPGSVRDGVRDALLRGDRPAAVALVDGVVEATEGIRRRDVEAARVAMEMFPPDVAAPRAATLLLRALRQDASAEGGAWALAQELRKQTIRWIDVASGERLLRGLMEIYPSELSYRRDLALLYISGGRAEDARAELEGLLSTAPSDVRALWELALIDEQLGMLESAVERYEAIIRATGDLSAHRSLARVLISAVRDHDAAAAAIERGIAAARAAPVGESRDQYLEALETERERLAEEVQKRDRLLAMDARLDRIIWSTAAGWAAVLVVGVLTLRRRGLV